MSDMMTQEESMNMSNEQAVQILIPMRNMMFDQYGCPISDAVFALDKAIEALSADRPQKVIAQITFDEEKLHEIIKEAIERFKKEYEVTDRPQGEWILAHKGTIAEGYYCSNCGKHGYITDFCPNCGAKMGYKDETDRPDRD